jgi:outer membrane protein
VRAITKPITVLALPLAASLAATAETKFGFFDFQRVSEETSKGQELQSSLTKFREKKQGEIASKENDLKTMRDQYSAQALSLSPDKRAQLEKDIQKKELDLQSLREGAQREMQIEVNEAQQKFQEQLLKVVGAIGKDKGYTAIFERSQAVFSSDSVDMTGEVIERFNQETAKDTPPPAPAPEAGAAGKPAGEKPAPPKTPAPKGATGK